MPDLNLLCSPDRDEFCWNDLDLWLDALARQADILSTQERSDTSDLFTTLRNTYSEPNPPSKQPYPLITINVGKIGALRDRLHADVGVLNGMMSSAHKAQANSLIDSLHSNHP